MLRRPGLLQHDPGQAAGDESGDVDEDGRQRDTARRGEVERGPDRIEFLLVSPQAAEIIEVLAVPVEEGAKAMPRDSPMPDRHRSPLRAVESALDRGQMAGEPSSRETGNLLQGAGLLEQMRRARNDRKLALAAGERVARLLVEFDHAVVLPAHDEQR